MTVSATPFLQRQNYPHVLSGLAHLDDTTATTLPIPCGGRGVVRLGFPSGTDGTTATFLVQAFPPADPAAPTADPPFRSLVDRAGAAISITVTDDSLVEIPQLSGCFAFQVVMGTAQSPAADIEVQCVGASPVPFEEADGGVSPSDFAAPAFTLGNTNTAGSSGKVVASDSAIAVFSASAPTVGVGSTAAAGSGAIALRSTATLKIPITLGGLIPLSSAYFKRVVGENLSTGNNILYTAPANTRAAILSQWDIYNGGGIGVITSQPYIQFQGTGTRYPISSVSTALATGAGATPVGGGFVLEPGDVIGVTTSTSNGLNANFGVIEFPSTVPLYTSWKKDPASGDNTIYTCPAAVSAIFFGVTSLVSIVNQPIGLVNGSGGSLNVYYNVVRSGQTPSSSNQQTAASAVAGITVTRSSTGNVTGMPLNVGDFINVNWSGANTGGLTWLTVAEIAGA